MSNQKTPKDDNFVPMTNMDPSNNIPGSLTPKERSKIDLAKVQHKDVNEVEIAKSSKKPANKPASRELSFMDPTEAREPIHKDSNEIKLEDLPKPVKKTRQKKKLKLQNQQ